MRGCERWGSARAATPLPHRGRVSAGKPHCIVGSERVQLSGTYNVRKGKMQLPVNRWTRRQVILCGTCLIVSSVKDSQTGKMHVLPLIGGKVRDRPSSRLRSG